MLNDSALVPSQTPDKIGASPVMHRDHALHSAGELLSQSDKLSSIVSALARAAHSRPLDEEDRQALEEASSFLEEVEEGYNWMENPTPNVSKESRLYAQALHAAVDSWVPGNDSGRFLDDIDDMSQKLESVRNNEDVDRDSLHDIIGFFNNMLSSRLDELDDIYSDSTINNRDNQWESAISLSM